MNHSDSTPVLRLLGLVLAPRIPRHLAEADRYLVSALSRHIHPLDVITGDHKKTAEAMIANIGPQTDVGYVNRLTDFIVRCGRPSELKFN